MRGFFFGSLSLAVLYGLLNNAENAGKTLGFTQRVFYRLLSPEVAGVPDRKGTVGNDDQGVSVQPTSSTTPNAAVAPFVPSVAPWATPISA